MTFGPLRPQKTQKRRARSFVRSPTIAPRLRRGQRKAACRAGSLAGLSRRYNAVVKSLIFKALQRFAVMRSRDRKRGEAVIGSAAAGFRQRSASPRQVATAQSMKSPDLRV